MFVQDVEKSADDWQRWAEAEAPESTPMPGGAHALATLAKTHSTLDLLSSSIMRQHLLFAAHTLAGQWAQLSPFQRILVLRALKPDRVPAALGALCEATLGTK